MELDCARENRQSSMSSRRRARTPQTGATCKASHRSESSTRPHTSGSSRPSVDSSRPRELQFDPATDHRVKAFRPPRPTTETRHRVAATWSRPVLPTHRDWQTESRSTIGKGTLHQSHDFLDIAFAKKRAEMNHYKLNLVNKARTNLSDLATRKFGSIRNMFREFDDDKNGRLSIDELSKAIKRRNLENVFPRDQQRLIFEVLDKDRSTKLDINEFMAFFNVDSASLQAQPRHLGSGFASLQGTKNSNEIIDPRVRSIKDKLIEKLFARTSRHKLEGGREYATEHLLEAFRQIDEDMSGKLSRDEIQHALGPDHLNLGVGKAEVDMLVAAMDTANDGEVSYSEFVKFLEVHDIDPGYNPIFDSRQREIAKLHTLVNPDWKYHGETQKTAEAFETLNSVRGRDARLRPVRDTFQPEDDDPCALSDFLQHRPSRASDTFAPESTSQNSPHRRSRVQNSDQLFEDMQATQVGMLSSICPRFLPQPPTDWSRVGYGGNGTNPSSGIYLDGASRFQTTNSLHFSSLVYSPSEPVRRACKSDADIRAENRKAKLLRKQQVLKRTAQATDERIRLSEAMMEMDSEQRLRRKATEMLRYFSATYQRDEEETRRRNGMHKKGNKKQFDRMWNGSKDNQFHAARRQEADSEARRNWSTVFRDIGQSSTQIVAPQGLGLTLMSSNR